MYLLKKKKGFFSHQLMNLRILLGQKKKKNLGTDEYMLYSSIHRTQEQTGQQSC